MPLFKTRCAQCQRESEEFIHNREDALPPCPCGGEQRRVMTPSRFTMPGNRFYPSIGEYCATDAEYMQKVDALKRKEDDNPSNFLS